MMNAALQIARKDVLLDMRTLRSPVISLVFSLMVIASFRYAFADYGEFEIHGMPLLAAASIWISISLSGMLSISRSFLEERENGCINALFMSPRDPSYIYVGKFLSNSWRVGLSGFFSVLWFTALFDLPANFPAVTFVGVCLGGMLGIAAVGSFVGPVAARCGSGRETIFIIMIMPLILFIVVLSVLATASLFDGSDPAGISEYLIPLIFLDFTYFLSSMLLFEYAAGP